MDIFQELKKISGEVFYTGKRGNMKITKGVDGDSEEFSIYVDNKKSKKKINRAKKHKENE